jgi:hypothetical protein
MDPSADAKRIKSLTSADKPPVEKAQLVAADIERVTANQPS